LGRLCWGIRRWLPRCQPHALAGAWRAAAAHLDHWPLLTVIAVSGDLAESVIKRCTEIKDSGRTLPGIGGILDLTDSLLFTAPVFYAYLCWL
jgi:predicted CDP-diglyceride synthetase/phosphatidate cytidylyltransferase